MRREPGAPTPRSNSSAALPEVGVAARAGRLEGEIESPGARWTASTPCRLRASSRRSETRPAPAACAASHRGRRGLRQSPRDCRIDCVRRDVEVFWDQAVSRERSRRRRRSGRSGRRAVAAPRGSRPRRTAGQAATLARARVPKVDERAAATCAWATRSAGVSFRLLDDVSEVRLVVVRHPEGELEAAGADQLPQRLEARLDVAPFPAGDLRLRPLHPPAELGLGDPGPQPRLLEQICTDHQYEYAISLVQG